MKKNAVNRFLVAGVLLMSAPVSLFAQVVEKPREQVVEKAKEKGEKQEMDQIIITRRGESDAKTVIEIHGDKVIVNGKETKDGRSGDVMVNRHRVRDFNAIIASAGRNGNFQFNMDKDAITLFSEDENRAMLGVVTEGDDKGARIVSVSKESAAEKAGLKAKDVITAIEGDRIDDTDDVSRAVRKHKPGTKVSITYLRDGKEGKATAELGKWKGVRVNAVAPPRMPSVEAYGPLGGTFYAGPAPRLGLSIQDSEDGKGVKVLEVDEESNAAKAGVKENDVITHFNDEEIDGVDELSRLFRANRAKPSFNVKVVRNGKTQTLEVRVPRKLKTADL